jgi:phytoene dehydrogenase-like protein
MADSFDAVVVGGGPNGLAAAIAIARAGRSVGLFEARPTVGGGARSAQLTLPGFVHDVCSAVHPLGVSSPFFASLSLERHGLRWIEPPFALGHPLDEGSAVLVGRDLAATAATLGPDGEAYRRLLGPLVDAWSDLVPDVLAPFHVPLDPVRLARLARFGMLAAQPVSWLAHRFEGPRARAVLAGCAAHSMLRLRAPVTGAYALVFLASAHAVGWPVAEGGSGRIADALLAELRAHGGEIVTGRHVDRIESLPAHRVALFDVTPRQLLAIAGERLRGRYAASLRSYRYGSGSFKVDLALDGPIPWRNPELARAGTVHLGGTFEEIAAAEAATYRGRASCRPFVLLAQPSLFDPTRAPAGGQTAWAYCHVPAGSTVDMTEPILRQIERFAPGFRDRLLGIHVMGPAALEMHDPNLVGGDIGGGLQDLRQLFTRPVPRIDPYSTPDPRIVICSASTPPGPGVHGMCGYFGARSALAHALR